METSVIVGLVCTLLGAAIGYATFLHNAKKSSENEGRETGNILTEIGYIKSNTDEIKVEQKETRKSILDIITRLTAVESSAKQAHHRIDRLEGREGE